jgi:hypothetical protein
MEPHPLPLRAARAAAFVCGDRRCRAKLSWENPYKSTLARHSTPRVLLQLPPPSTPSTPCGPCLRPWRPQARLRAFPPPLFSHVLSRSYAAGAPEYQREYFVRGSRGGVGGNPHFAAATVPSEQPVLAEQSPMQTELPDPMDTTGLFFALAPLAPAKSTPAGAPEYQREYFVGVGEPPPRQVTSSSRCSRCSRCSSASLTISRSSERK